MSPLAKRRLCLGPAGVINCTPLSPLSFWVSLFPGKHGYNIWCIGRETPHFEETGLIWGHPEALCLESPRGGEGASPLWKNSAFQSPVSSLWQVVNGSRELSAQVRRSPPSRVEEGAWSPPWEGPEGSRIGDWFGLANPAAGDSGGRPFQG